MYKVKKHYYDGYAVFPCFKVKALVNGYGCDMVCNDFLSFIFSIFIAPFWSGKIFIVGEHWEE